VSGSSGTFTVSGSHTYASAGTDTVSVTLSDDAPGTATATATSTANITTGQEIFTLTTGVDTVAGDGDDTINAGPGTLNSGDNINGGGGTTALVLQGAGIFNLGVPATLVNIGVIDVQEGQPAFGAFAAKNQIIDLRNGLDATVNVLPAVVNAGNPNKPIITIVGAHNADVINLGSGNDSVNVGDTRETVNGGTGTDTVTVSSSTIGATIGGGSGGANTLQVTGGGTMSMGANITNMQTVLLGSAATPYNFTANSLTGLVVNDLSSGFDTISAGGLNQTLTGGAAGHETMMGYSGGNSTFKDTTAKLNGDTIGNFTATGSAIDLTDMNSALVTLSFNEDASNTFGTLHVTDGTHVADIKLLVAFAPSFNTASDGSLGTLISDPPVVNHNILVASH
jgi:hypothetical protein